MTSFSPGWLLHAIRYAEEWIDFQMRLVDLPGCVFAVAQHGEVVRERAFGVADVETGEPLTPRHRFRVASHSKTFTSAAIMKLRERERLRLDDPVGKHVPELLSDVAAVTIAQLLAHTSGLIRDGADSGHWLLRQPFFGAAELQAELARPLVLPPNERFKYSNVGFGLLGKMIETIAGIPYVRWIAEEILAPAGLTETTPDIPIPAGVPMARGHGLRLPLSRRPVFAGDTPTNALAAATGFVSTASDLVHFFSQLSPNAEHSLLLPESRREMTHRQWRAPYAQQERYYGLGTMSGEIEQRAWFGHMGVFPGYITRTAVVPEWEVALSILTNANDGAANAWMDGALHIMSTFAREGAPDPAVADWAGRWWSHWGAVDLVPAGHKVLAGSPTLAMPLLDASEIAISDRTNGRITLANGYANHGEPVHRVPGPEGAFARLWLAGTELKREADLAIELAEWHPKP